MLWWVGIIYCWRINLISFIVVWMRCLGLIVDMIIILGRVI